MNAKHTPSLLNREEAPKSLEPAEQPFDLIAACIQGDQVPWRAAIVFRGTTDIPSSGQLSCLIAFIRSIH